MINRTEEEANGNDLQLVCAKKVSIQMMMMMMKTVNIRFAYTHLFIRIHLNDNDLFMMVEQYPECNSAYSTIIKSVRNV